MLGAPTPATQEVSRVLPDRLFVPRPTFTRRMNPGVETKRNWWTRIGGELDRRWRTNGQAGDPDGFGTFLSVTGPTRPQGIPQKAPEVLDGVLAACPPPLSGEPRRERPLRKRVERAVDALPDRRRARRRTAAHILRPPCHAPGQLLRLDRLVRQAGSFTGRVVQQVGSRRPVHGRASSGQQMSVAVLAGCRASRNNPHPRPVSAPGRALRKREDGVSGPRRRSRPRRRGRTPGRARPPGAPRGPGRPPGRGGSDRSVGPGPARPVPTAEGGRTSVRTTAGSSRVRSSRAFGTSGRLGVARAVSSRLPYRTRGRSSPVRVRREVAAPGRAVGSSPIRPPGPAPAVRRPGWSRSARPGWFRCGSSGRRSRHRSGRRRRREAGRHRRP